MLNNFARSTEHLKQNSPMSLWLIRALQSSGNSCPRLGGSSSIFLMNSHCLFLGIFCQVNRIATDAASKFYASSAVHGFHNEPDQLNLFDCPDVFHSCGLANFSPITGLLSSSPFNLSCWSLIAADFELSACVCFICFVSNLKFAHISLPEIACNI